MAIGGRKALVLGATGLVGKNIITRLLERDEYESINAVCRRTCGRNHKKIDEIIVDFDKLADYAEVFKVDDVFCCLGTTMKKAGGKEEFRKVDFDYVLEAGKLAAENGVKQFVLISAHGANTKSTVFYNQVKGEIEDEIHKLLIPGIQIVRPSLLLGYRKETRIKEKLGAPLMKTLNFLPGKMGRNTAPITASMVAYAMIKIATNAAEGFHIFESGDLKDIATGKYTFRQL